MKTYIIFYDITNNKSRNLVVKQLKKAGFYRIQKSVFMGTTTESHLQNLEELFDSLLQKEDAEFDSYVILPLNELSLKQMAVLNLKIDLELITARKIVIFV